MQSRDILIMSTSGSPQQCKVSWEASQYLVTQVCSGTIYCPQVNQTILAVFERFVSDNADRMEDLFHQMDKDKSGNITLEEFKYGLKDFGLRLTSVSMRWGRMHLPGLRFHKGSTHHNEPHIHDRAKLQSLPSLCLSRKSGSSVISYCSVWWCITWKTAIETKGKTPWHLHIVYSV